MMNTEDYESIDEVRISRNEENVGAALAECFGPRSPASIASIQFST